MNQYRVAKIAPRHHYLGVVCFDRFSPKVAWVAGPAEDRVNHPNSWVFAVGSEHSLNRSLQPSYHRYIVGIDAPRIVGQLAL
jgi:hypothetical protein